MKSWGCLSEWKEICMEPPFVPGLIMSEDESNLFCDIMVHMSHQLGVPPSSLQLSGNLMLNEGGIKLELPSSSSETHLTTIVSTPLEGTSGSPKTKEVPSTNEAQPTSTTPLLAISKPMCQGKCLRT